MTPEQCVPGHCWPPLHLNFAVGPWLTTPKEGDKRTCIHCGLVERLEWVKQ
jgi:hypothetical protein